MDLCPADSTADMEEDKGDDEDELGNMAALVKVFSHFQRRKL